MKKLLLTTISLCFSLLFLSAQMQIGADIDGEAAFDQSGFSVSISNDGSIVAIGALGNNGNGSVSGHVRLLEWNGSNWVQKGADIDGEAVGDNSGWSVSLSSDGTRVAIGASGNDGNGNNAGHTRVYENNGPLPVSLVNFRASAEVKSVTLHWQTASETNNLGFDIQRSKNGTVWETIGFENGRGTIDAPNEYVFIDLDPFPGTNYYRLKQIDFDGSFEYSRTLSVNFILEQPRLQDFSESFPWSGQYPIR